MKGRKAANCNEQAEAFRRKLEILGIFRGLPERLRKQPSGEATKDAVLNRLKEIGIMSSERTLDAGLPRLRRSEIFTRGETFCAGRGHLFTILDNDHEVFILIIVDGSGSCGH